ncbi:hypothetical protein [Geomonas ferrireducens]|uniref:hypothetical protein n=1 Tax=Geomonas ferrireducens TaxID=2570227 RepID=UPI0010A79FAE|nr:hypothetical protein [Geomonas ferrireducens]
MNTQLSASRKILVWLFIVVVVIGLALTLFLVFGQGNKVREIAFPWLSVKLDPPAISPDSTKSVSTQVPGLPADPSRSAKTVDTQQFSVPSEALVFYVILQERGKEENDHSSRTIAVAKRDIFLQELPRYIEQARKENKMLVVTAATFGEPQWVHAKIKCRDTFLNPARYRDPGSPITHTGVEIPLD